MTARSILVPVDEPGLVVLIGAAGSGKTTLAARLFAPDEVISSDALRAVVSGDAANQRATRPAFAILHREVGRRLADGHLIVVDATSVERTARRELLRGAVIVGAPAVALVLALPGDLVQARNAARPGRPVPPDVVERHLARVARLMDGGPDAAVAALLAEGFASAVVVRSDVEVARLRIDRGTAISPR